MSGIDAVGDFAHGRLHRPWRKLSRRTWALVAAVLTLLVVATAIAIGGSSGKGGESAGTSSSSVGPGVASPLPAVVDGSGAATGGSAVGSIGSTSGAVRAPAAVPAEVAPSVGTVPSVVPGDSGAKVVKTGEVDLQVSKGKVGTTLDRLSAIATLERGYVQQTRSSEGTDASGSMTLRVPANAFEDAVSKVRALGAKVLSVQTQGDDVTGEYVDLKARLHSLTATRRSFERLLAQATTIGETLEVENRITDVQTQIEQLQGRIHVLDDQSGYGTLTVTVDQNVVGPAPVKHERSGMSRAFHRSVDRFVNGIEAIVGILGPLLLVLVVGAVVLVVVRVGYRLVRRQLV